MTYAARAQIAGSAFAGLHRDRGQHASFGGCHRRFQPTFAHCCDRGHQRIQHCFVARLGLPALAHALDAGLQKVEDIQFRFTAGRTRT